MNGGSARVGKGLSTIYGGGRRYMSKQEFLEKLRQALTGKVASSVVTENINYYEDYINVEVRKGRSEEEVLNQLGDPRLIARTIVETSGGSQSAEGIRGRSSTYYERSAGENASSLRRRVRIPGWMALILLLMVVVLILSFVFSVVTALLPVLLPILVVVFLVKLFRDWLN